MKNNQNHAQVCRRQTLIVVDDSFKPATGDVFSAVGEALSSNNVPASLFACRGQTGAKEIVVEVSNSFDMEDCEPHEAILDALEGAGIPASLVMRTARPIPVLMAA
ncbi:hypothetical protein AB4Y45_32540 [Paraburkholderia sp. EG287A]|uniref:hypothetical protein n=1 Tax=Paraburkholderia sp. EG287A TaxID=3237012 RepID=UPI0034D154D3